MKRLLESYSDGIYAAMRVVLGLLFWCHGAQKSFGILGGQSQDLASLLGVAGLIEVIGGVLIAAGLFTTYTAFLSSGLVAVGYFLAHFPLGFVPIQNGGELAVVYAFVFLFIAARGGGRWSVDALLWGSPEPLLPVKMDDRA